MDPHLPEEARNLPFLCVVNANEHQFRTNRWRVHRSYFFYGDWRELRACYRIARLLLAGEDAADEMRRIRWCYAGEAHAAQLGILMNTADLEAHS